MGAPFCMGYGYFDILKFEHIRPFCIYVITLLQKEQVGPFNRPIYPKRVLLAIAMASRTPVAVFMALFHCTVAMIWGGVWLHFTEK